jgi:hypothetical protein
VIEQYQSQRGNLSIIAVEIGVDDVGGFDVSVQQTPLVGVVQCAGDSGNDGYSEFGGHTCGVALLNQLGCVGAVDVVHRDLQLAVVFTAIVYADDVGMP